MYRINKQLRSLKLKYLSLSPAHFLLSAWDSSETFFSLSNTVVTNYVWLFKLKYKIIEVK